MGVESRKYKGGIGGGSVCGLEGLKKTERYGEYSNIPLKAWTFECMNHPRIPAESVSYVR